MLLDFFKKRSLKSKKQSEGGPAEENKGCNSVISTIQSGETKLKETFEKSKTNSLEFINSEENISNGGPVKPNSTKQVIPTWATSWLRQPKKVEASDQKQISTSNPNSFNNQDHHVNPDSSNPEHFKTSEIPTEDLTEPRNVEVREMVLRQIQMSRSTARYMCSNENLVEEQIRKSMERGDFKNLKGKGKPLKFEENPFEDPELRLPFKILKDAGFAPYWVEMGKEIDAEIDGCHMFFEKFLETLTYRKARHGYLMRTPEFEARMDEVMQICANKIEEANKKIDKYNMVVPMYWLQRKKLDEDFEMTALRRRLDEFLWGNSR